MKQVKESENLELWNLESRIRIAAVAEGRCGLGLDFYDTKVTVFWTHADFDAGIHLPDPSRLPAGRRTGRPAGGNCREIGSHGCQGFEASGS